MRHDTILIVDDEAELVELIAAAMKKYFAKVVTATDGLKAKEILLAERPNFIVTDVNMPGLSGLDLIQAARTEGVETLAIIMTGGADRDTAIDALRLGVSDFIEKPFDMGELAVRIERAIVISKKEDQINSLKSQSGPDDLAIQERKRVGLIRAVNRRERKKTA